MELVIRSSTIAPNGLLVVRGGRGNSLSLFAMLSGPMKMRWKVARGNKCVICTHTSLGREDSALAPRMKSRTGGGVGRSPLISPLAPVRGG